MRRITGYIYSYSRKARESIIATAKTFLEQSNIQEISNGLFSCVDELVKNAVKANYKFILILDEIQGNIAESFPDKSREELDKEVFDLIKVHDSFDHVANDILRNKNISAEVREILNEEAKLLSIKDKAYLNKSIITDEEKLKVKTLKKLNNMKIKIKDKDIKIILKMQADDDFIYIEVTNTAPILSKDLNRIYQKREEYKKYRDRGNEHEFFINNLDTSESGFGLGYATIDSILCDWGLDPERTATIISAINTTVMLAIPIAELRKATSANNYS